MTTPVRRQYLALKKQYPDVILFFRLGDFYETFDEDARIVAEVCDIVLTSRPVGKNQRVPLAGVPYHAAESYIAKLIRAGYKVAIAEQKGTTPVKGLVPRQVRRVVTPGTLVEPGLLEEKSNNYLAALLLDERRAGMAYADITTGEFAATQFEGDGVRQRVAEELARLQPAEVVISEQGTGVKGYGEGGSEPLIPYPLSPIAPWRFELETARQALLDHFGATSLAGYGCEGQPLAVRAAGALVQYLRDTQPDALAQLAGLRTYATTEYMTLDEATWSNLELVQTIRSGSARGSLLGVLDVTRTPMGGRLLRRWLGQPLLDVEAINRRLDAVQAWVNDTPRRLELREALRGVGDLERWITRVVQRIAQPRDLVGIRETLARVPQIHSLVEVQYLLSSPLDPCADVLAFLQQAIADEPPATLTSTGIIRPGFSAELDGIAAAARDAKAWIAGLERKERERTGIKSLKVGYNKVFGYYIEVSKANQHLVPAEYIRKQTLVNAERYITPDLKEYESLVLNAQERLLDLESQLYRQVLDQVAAAAPRVQATAQALAELDVVTSLAEVAVNHRYVRPQIADDGCLDIVAGRHPVVELLQRDEPFQPNDVHLSPEEAIIILTGPNMSGKCLAGDTVVVDAKTGRSFTVAELHEAGRGITVQSLSSGRWLTTAQTSPPWSNGVRPTYRLTVSGGLCIEATANHRFLTDHGWRELRALQIGDRIAVAWHQRVAWRAIDDISPASVQEVFDLEVPETACFVANGIITHNSTYLRQVALIVLMAQMGSFVPADEARIGVVDRIFTRIGAADEIAAGRSTFMVEMVETANILHHATPRSLLILDEIGRGTSTYDGMSIAWAVVEYIHNHPRLQAKTLFATHYHELTELARLLPRVRNYNVAVAGEGDQIVFLHKIVPGSADRSYGIHVAQLAGLPRVVIHRAQEILAELEKQAPGGPLRPRHPAVEQLPLFLTEDPVLEELKTIDITQLTPLEAINKLYELQQRLQK